MIIPIYWAERTRIKNLPELLAQHRSHGGRLVEYQSVWSALVLSRTTPRIVWLPDEANRHVRGLVHSLPTLILGWWSVAGFFWTINTLVKNLMGGVDVTAVFTTPPPLDGQAWDGSALAAIEKQRKIQAWAFAGVLFALLAVVCWFCVVTYI